MHFCFHFCALCFVLFCCLHQWPEYLAYQVRCFGSGELNIVFSVMHAESNEQLFIKQVLASCV